MMNIKGLFVSVLFLFITLEVTEYLSKKPLSEEAANQINNNIERFESLHPEYTMAKEKLGVKKLDFRIEAHRVAIGQALVELKYAEEQKSESKE